MKESSRYFQRLSAMTHEARRKLREYGHRKERLDDFDEVTWAVLQHYGCETPLLDITQSLHVALCFATYDYHNEKRLLAGTSTCWAFQTLMVTYRYLHTRA